jgi:hypothetical protein
VRLVLPARDVIRATPRTRIIQLELGDQPLAFQAGQAVVAGLPGSPVRKPYSIACSPGQAARDRVLELLVQVDDSGSPDPHLERVTPGTAVEIDGPFGAFVLDTPPVEPAVLFLAGGTGIAPLRSMLWRLLEQGWAGRVALLYSARADRPAARQRCPGGPADACLPVRPAGVCRRRGGAAAGGGGPGGGDRLRAVRLKGSGAIPIPRTTCRQARRDRGCEGGDTQPTRLAQHRAGAVCSHAHLPDV